LDSQSALNPQYEMALKAIQSLDESNFNELRSYRSPPQRVLAVVNTLCLMFRQPPGWESGKQLLLRENFFDELVFYDKKNIPDDIFNALKQICAVETFRPEHVAPGSKAAASFCTWILAIYEFSKYERTYGIKIKEFKAFEEQYNKRLVQLGEKRLNAEKKCLILDEHCTSRLNVLKDMKLTHLEIERLKESKEKAKHILSLLDQDQKSWTAQRDTLSGFMFSYKMDALLTAAFICYSGIFDFETRNKIIEKWTACLNKMSSNLSRSVKIDENCESTAISSGETLPAAPSISALNAKYTLRNNFNFKDILLNEYENKELTKQLYKLSLQDEYYVQNVLILKELSSLPSQMSWPLVYDAENCALKIITLLHETIENLKSTLNTEFTFSSPMTGMSRIDLFDNNNNQENNANNMDDTISNLDEREDSFITSKSNRSSAATLNYKMSGASRKSLNTQMSEHSSIWEASNFCSRAHSANTVYHPKSGKNFLPSLLAEYETNLMIPLIETDLTQIGPKHNMCLIDSSDTDIDYKLVNAAVHGLTVFLKNSERFEQPNRLIEVLFERDFLYDSNLNREYLKFGSQKIVISPKFKLILQINTPIHFNHVSTNNHMFHRLTTQLNASHACLNFSFSSNFISNDLLNSIMEMEKAGYANQKYLLDKIILDYDFNTYLRQVSEFKFKNILFKI